MGFHFLFRGGGVLPISIHAGIAGTGEAVTVLRCYGLLGADINYATATSSLTGNGT